MNKFTKEENILIQKEFEEMLQASSFTMTEEQKELITKAFNLANSAHENMRRKSGEPYILHPIAVAKIATNEIGLGTKSIVAALLHDVVEDTDFTIEDIELQFGKKIASMVDGLTKISDIFNRQANVQTESFRKILMTMADDLRVILIKLADRLHNMRTLSSMPVNKQIKTAGETSYIYAPLAHRLGLYTIKTELEDLCLKYLHPDEYNSISKQVKENEKKRITYINRFSLPITNKLNEEGFSFEISGRAKSIYSIWNKMETKHVSFDEIYDLLALRIIFNPQPGISEKTQCWNIYSIITEIYKPHKNRTRDWISHPKSNGYEALHTTLMGQEGRWVEVQIRSKRMNEIAERGYAAHWKYKGINQQESRLDEWIRDIRAILENPETDTLEFLDNFKLNLFNSEITVFSPRGEEFSLPSKATALDFAFHVHTQVGLHAVGAKVNYKLVSLNHKLNSGDRVEIITSEKQVPQPEWRDFVVSGKALSALKDIHKDNVQIGKKHLEYLLSELKLEPNSYIFRKLFDHYNTHNKDSLYSKIGIDKFDTDEFKKILSKRSLKKRIKFWQLQSTSPKQATENFNKSQPLVVDDKTSGYKIASCCNPIPGDDVIGHKNNANNLIIHKTSCKNAIRLNSSEGHNVVKVEWISHKVTAYLGRISLKGIDNMGIVNKITSIISKELNVNMRSISFESLDGIFEGLIDIYVHNNQDLKNLINKLSRMKGMKSVKRIEITDNN